MFTIGSAGHQAASVCERPYHLRLWHGTAILGRLTPSALRMLCLNAVPYAPFNAVSSVQRRRHPWALFSVRFVQSCPCRPTPPCTPVLLTPSSRCLPSHSSRLPLRPFKSPSKPPSDVAHSARHSALFTVRKRRLLTRRISLKRRKAVCLHIGGLRRCHPSRSKRGALKCK
jgi:hypothetical protein